MGVLPGALLGRADGVADNRTHLLPPACSSDSMQSSDWPEAGSEGSAGPEGAKGAAGLIPGEELKKELEAAASIQSQRLW
jgi:hypothetical protein